MMRSVIPRHGWSPQRLFAMLKDCQAREKESWRKTLLSNSVNQQAEVSSCDRDYAVTWLSHLNSRFNFYPETFFLAVHNLDRFLTTVKSRPKYLKCIAATCLYVASKIVEEEEHIPGTRELVEISRCGCRPGDILRMERIILTKLSWDFHTPTALTYLEIFYALIFSSSFKRVLMKEDAEQSENFKFLIKHLNQLTAELQHAICSYSLTPFPSAALALALLSLRMENLSSEPQSWATITSQIQAVAKVNTSDLMQCRDVLRSILPLSLDKKRCTNPGNTVYLISSSNLFTPQWHKPESSFTQLQGVPTKRKAQDLNENSPAAEAIKKFHHTESYMTDRNGNYHEQAGPGTESKSQEKLAHIEPNNRNTVKIALESVSQGMQMEDDDCPPLTKPVDPYVGDLLVNSEVPEEYDLETSVESYECIEYDSDKTLTASEGEDDDFMENRKKHEAARMRPLTYAEIVKFGLIESAGTVATMIDIRQDWTNTPLVKQ